MCEIDWSSIAIVIATCVGPILAVWASDYRSELRRIYQRKESVFHSLMATRGARMQIEHVSALNRIELAFPRLSHPHVVDAWELYLRHLGTDQGSNKEDFDRWSEIANNLFHDMLQAMANALHIPFTKSSIKYNAYYPKGYDFTEYQQNELRSLLLSVLKEGRPINIRTIVDAPLEKEKMS